MLSSFGRGGQERVALDLARGQAARGHSVCAISLAGPGPLGDEFARQQIATLTLQKKVDGFDFRLPFALSAIFRRLQCDVVHTHNPQPLIYAAPVARLVGCRTVHTKHGANPSSSRTLFFRNLAARFVDRTVAVSATTAEVAKQRHEAPLDRLRVIENGIDLSRFGPDAASRQQIRRELGIESDAFVVGTVGRLAKEKNQALLLRAIAPLLSQKCQLVMVGDGEEAPALRAQIAALPKAQQPAVHLAGARDDVPRWLASFDVFALSSNTEGLPLVILEAMATALPIVSTTVGGIAQVVVDEECGLLVAAGDEAGMRDKINSLEKNRALGENYGAGGRALALECYSAEHMVEAYLALYREIVQRHA